MTSYLLKNGLLYGEKKVDLLLKNQVISAIEPCIIDAADKVIDLKEAVVLPGLVDMHTHLREPGDEAAETIVSGSKAAALGGYTAIHAMANTTPVADTAAVVEQVYHKGIAAGYVHVQPVGAVTAGLGGKTLADIASMATSDAHVKVFSDDGICVADPLVMRRALEYVKTTGGVIAQHAQDPRLTVGAQMHEGKISAQLGLSGWPAVAEESIIARDCLLAQQVDTKIHICHVSTAGSVEVIRWAKNQGIKVTAEVTPHHLLLTEHEALQYNPLYKVNPPLRTEADIHALKNGLRTGIIDCIGTDHAPHTDEKKACEWASAAMGMIGLETSLALIYELMVQSGNITFKKLAHIMSEKPADIGSLTQQGQKIIPGSIAHLTVFDPDHVWTVDPQKMATKSNNSPIIGRKMHGKVLYTFFNGKMTVQEGKMIS